MIDAWKPFLAVLNDFVTMDLDAIGLFQNIVWSHFNDAEIPGKYK